MTHTGLVEVFRANATEWALRRPGSAEGTFATERVVALVGVELVVDAASRQRAHSLGSSNVHAWLRGELAPPEPADAYADEVRFMPVGLHAFVLADGSPAPGRAAAALLYFDDSGRARCLLRLARTVDP